jgi:hypothetical protein
VVVEVERLCVVQKKETKRRREDEGAKAAEGEPGLIVVIVRCLLQVSGFDCQELK